MAGRAGRATSIATFALLSCAPPEEQPAVTTPAPTTDSEPTTPTQLEDSGDWEPSDTGITVTDLVPAATVRIVQAGDLTFDPPGGPWTTVTGTVTVNEYADGIMPDTGDTAVPTDTAAPPACELTFAVAGDVVPAPGCPDCDVAFDLRWELTEGDPGGCHDPDLPETGATWRLGWSAASATVKFDYYGSGVWVDWYLAEAQGDHLRIAFDTTKAVAVEEEE